MSTVTLDNVTPSDAAQSILKLMGEPYSLRNYPMFVDIFNTPFQRRLMRSGRQVSKTVTMAADIITEASTNPYMPIIYANSSGQQTSSFSSSKLDPFLLHSPIVYENLMKSKHLINNVFHKRFKNSAEIILSYFSESADRIRGKTGYRMYIDEVQDILYDAVVDAEECLSAAPDPRFTYAGTSKTMSSTLEYFWTLSTKKEWILKCDSCGVWNIPDMDNIGLHGLICKKCGGVLNTFSGQWHSFSEEEDPQYDGYHIPQIIMPMHCENELKWKELLRKRDNYPEYKFLNEVMGIPMGEGDNPITESMLRAMCLDSLIMEHYKTEANSLGCDFIAAGIDWGGSGVEGTSRTTLSIYAVYPANPKYIKIYGKIFGGGEPSKHVTEIAGLLRAFNVNMCFADHGGGNFAISQLRNCVPDIRIVPVMYTDQSAPYRWDDNAGRYTVNRTVMIDGFLNEIKQQKVFAMRWEEFKQFASDILNVHEEIIGEAQGKPRRVWRRYPSKPDDCLHSMVFGWFCCKVLANQLYF